MEYPSLNFNSDFRPWKFAVFQGPFCPEKKVPSPKKKITESSNYPGASITSGYYFKLAVFSGNVRGRQGFSRPQEPLGLPDLLATSPMGVRRRWFHPVPFPLPPPPPQEPRVESPGQNTTPKRPEIRWVGLGGPVLYSQKMAKKKKRVHLGFFGQ